MRSRITPTRLSRASLPRAFVLVSLALACVLPATPAPAAKRARGRASAPAAPVTLAGSLTAQVAQAQRVGPALGVYVEEIQSGKEVFSYHGGDPLVLASNTKLLTTAAAIDVLGPTFAYETPLLLRGAVYDGILAGDLAVVGSGDPNISGRFNNGDSLAVFRLWAQTLVKRGVHQVSGDLYLVHGLFESQALHPDWPADQLARWYEAPVRALSFNDNCILVRALPGRERGAPGRVELDPPVDIYRVVPQVTTSGSPKAQRLIVTREPESHEILVSGSVYAGSGPLEAWVTIPDPVEYFGASLRLALAQEGIEIHGKVLPIEKLPGEVWERVAVHSSDLLTTLAVTNQHSQNFYAESLFKTLAAKGGKEGSWHEGVEVVSDFLHRAGLGDGFALADGSGMSRGNRAAPKQVAALLRYMFFHPAGAEFMRSLPMSGQPVGPWRHRLATGPYRGNVFAKTGTLSGVSALSGYAKGTSGKLYAFSIVLNGVGSVGRARRAQDGIVQALIDHG